MTGRRVLSGNAVGGRIGSQKKRLGHGGKTRYVGEETFRGRPASKRPLVLIRTRDRWRTNV